MTPEHLVQSQIMLECGKRGWLCFHANVGGGLLANGQWFTTGLPKGFPDLIIFRPEGKILFCECKSAVGRLRQDQVQFIGKLREYGYEVIVAHSIDEFRAEI